MDEHCWAMCSDNVIRHNKQELYRLNNLNGSNNCEVPQPSEGDIVGVSYDHIQLKFYLNGKELECPVTNVKGTVFPALYGKYQQFLKDILLLALTILKFLKFTIFNYWRMFCYPFSSIS